MLRFIVCHNDEPVKTYELDEPLITIGRLPENTISIANMGISRRHVRIERNANRTYVLTDLNSLNGTFVNNKKMKKGVLNSGDRISIGKYTIIMEMIGGDEGGGEAAQPGGGEAPALGNTPPAPAANPVGPAPTAAAGLPRDQPVLIETSRHVVYTIDKPIVSIGSSESDDVMVSGFMVGDGHVFVEKGDDGVWVYSSKAMARFRINGKKTNKHLLQHKDQIEVGNCAFRYMVNG